MTPRLSESADLREGAYLSVAQVQRIIPLARSTIYALCDSGALAHYRVGATARSKGRILVHRDDLRAFLEKSRQARPCAPTGRVDVDGLLDEIRGGRRRRA